MWQVTEVKAKRTILDSFRKSMENGRKTGKGYAKLQILRGYE
jgi:hypothetical protein